jgi:hypothetical protein
MAVTCYALVTTAKSLLTRTRSMREKYVQRFLLSSQAKPTHCPFICNQHLTAQSLHSFTPPSVRIVVPCNVILSADCIEISFHGQLLPQGSATKAAWLGVELGAGLGEGLGAGLGGVVRPSMQGLQPWQGCHKHGFSSPLHHHSHTSSNGEGQLVQSRQTLHWHFSVHLPLWPAHHHAQGSVAVMVPWLVGKGVWKTDGEAVRDVVGDLVGE